jgi:hypothetical protein
MNVKKVISLFLVFLLLIPNMGITVNVHYCGDSIAAISLHSELLSLTESENCCGETDLLEKGSCCKDRLVHLEKKADEATVKIVLATDYSPFIPVSQAQFRFVFTEKSNFKQVGSVPHYVAIPVPPLYQLYHQYIFYA